jgi:hypothetical protein
MPTHGVASLTSTLAEEAPSRYTATIILRRFRAAQRPALDLLWNNQLARVQSRSAVQDWLNGRRVSFAGFPAWQVPLNPTWREDPFKNASWRLYYQSLGWLLTIEASRQPNYQRQIADYLVDWIAKNDAGHWNSCPPWDDYAVSLRTDNMVRLLSGALKESLSTEQLSVVIQELGLHGQLLASYLDDPLWRGHNHSMFHALSLHSLASAFPELADAHDWKTRALRRMESLPSEIADPIEGVSLEQAPSYHYLDIDLFVRAEAYLSRWGEGLGADTRALLGRMLDYAAIITRLDGSLPAIGDTAYRATAPLVILREALNLGINSEMARFLLSGGAAGTSPPAASFYPRSGYAIFRSSRTGSADDLLHVVFDMGPSRRIHGHDDALNVVFADGKREVLVDSGGPYAYGNPGRFDFVIAPAHNLVLIPGEKYLPGDATVGRTEENDWFSMAEGWHTKYAGYRIQRAVVLLKGAGSLLIVDQVIPLSRGRSPTQRSFDLLYHLPPGNAVLPIAKGNRVTIRYAEGAMSIVGSGLATPSVVTGQTLPNLRGWVTPGYAEKVAAPMVTVSTTGTNAWFVTLIEPLAPGSQPTQRLEATRDPNGDYNISVLQPDAVWHLLLPTIGDATMGKSGS